jgi:hypothetical protein
MVIPNFKSLFGIETDYKTARGSLILPLRAVAATVAGLPR